MQQWKQQTVCFFQHAHLILTCFSRRGAEVGPAHCERSTDPPAGLTARVARRHGQRGGEHGPALLDVYNVVEGVAHTVFKGM